MAYEQRDNNGSLWKNDKQREGKNDPGYTGSCMVGGVEYWLSGWVKESPKGKFFSLAFKPKDVSKAKPASKPATAPTAQPAAPAPADTDDVPF